MFYLTLLEAVLVGYGKFGTKLRTLPHPQRASEFI
jgi:hypothetical protein